MPELYPSDAELAALSGTTDAEQEVLFVPIGESPYYVSFYKMLHRLLDVARRAGDLRVYKDGDLTFAVRAGRFMDGSTARDYAGASGQALTNNATNYIYLTPAGTLTVNTTGFPDPATTAHLPLATIVTSAGSYGFADLTDYRGRALLGPAAGISAAALQDALPKLYVSAGSEVADKITVAILARDAGNNNLTERVLARVWIATTDYGAPDATGNTVAVEVGTQIQEVLANAHYLIESNASGSVGVGITISGAATRYVMAEIDGKVYSSGAINWSA